MDFSPSGVFGFSYHSLAASHRAFPTARFATSLFCLYLSPASPCLDLFHSLKASFFRHKASCTSLSHHQASLPFDFFPLVLPTVIPSASVNTFISFHFSSTLTTGHTDFLAFTSSLHFSTYSLFSSHTLIFASPSTFFCIFVFVLRSMTSNRCWPTTGSSGITLQSVTSYLSLSRTRLKSI